MRVIAVATTYGEEDLEEADAVATSLQASALTTSPSPARASSCGL